MWRSILSLTCLSAVAAETSGTCLAHCYDATLHIDGFTATQAERVDGSLVSVHSRLIWPFSGHGRGTHRRI